MKSDSTVEITKVESAANRRAFLKVPFKVYAEDRAWVPQLAIERLEHISSRNPYFHHAEAQLFIASRGGEPVGRISAQIDKLHLKFHQDATGHFGFLDAIDDPKVFAALFDAAESWLRARKMRRICGPFSFSINDEVGLLVNGFDKPPFLMMGHARPYYRNAVESLGFSKAKDVFAYEFQVDQDLPKPISVMVAKAKASGDVVIRSMSKRNLRRDLAIIVDIFNDAWSSNWSFVPMTSAEIEKLGTMLSYLIKDEYIAIAEFRGEPAAMIVSLPDVNRWIADFRGSLLPFNWIKLIWRIMATKPEGYRIPLMGVRTKYRQSPAGAVLAVAAIEAVHSYHRSRGAKSSELSWILEDNIAVRRIIESLGAHCYKTYRIYEKLLD
jgi:hypothetical protein